MYRGGQKEKANNRLKLDDQFRRAHVREKRKREGGAQHSNTKLTRTVRRNRYAREQNTKLKEAELKRNFRSVSLSIFS